RREKLNKMNVPRQNPHEQVCPDFASDAYAEARNAMREENDALDDAAVVIMLTQAWNATNRVDRAAWDNSAREQEQREAQRALVEEGEREREAAARAQEERVEAGEEMKKNRLKYLDIPMRPPPTLPVEIPSRYAISKLQKGQYVELWYFTNAGLKYAKSSEATVDDDGMVAVAGKDGTLDWIPAAATKDSKSVVADRMLTWEDFTVAVRRILFAMEAASWTEQRITMLANFWGRLQAHPYRSSSDPLDTEALLVYQDEQRRAWHQAIGSPVGAWDISTIEETVLSRTRDEVYREDRRRKDREKDTLVSAHGPQGSNG
ncbi:hypothetical protein C0993_005612, partial [Termitomyces sp. T159_Od127]